MLELKEFENIQNAAASVTISPGILWFVLLGAIIIFGLIGVTLVYHWMKFSFNAKNALAVTFVYTTISVILIAIAFISIGYYQVAA